MAEPLSETALKLSQVIEREAQRRSALRSGTIFRVEQNFPMFRRVSSRLRSSLTSRSSSHSRRSVSTVAPTPESVPLHRGASGGGGGGGGGLDTIDSINSGPLKPIASTSTSPRASVRRSKSNSFSSNTDGALVNEDGLPFSLRQRVWVFFDDPQSSPGAYYFSVSLFFFIVLSTTVFIAQTERSLEPYMYTLNVLEAVCAGVFSIEFSLRAASAPSKTAFFRNVGNFVDVAAILPFYLETFLAVENAGSFGAIRIVRLTRVARVLKMSRYSSAIQVFVTAIAISMKALSMLLFLMGIAVVVFSSAIYFAEFTTDGCRRGGWIGACDLVQTNGSEIVYVYVGSLGGAAAAGAAPSTTTPLSTQCVCIDPNPYSSIATSFWWSIVTMSTVGYGDMTPVTPGGRMVGMATILTGMLVLALPITVIGTNFQKVMKSVMQQTMKSNVEYLKGKKRICREEIQAILQRFHAVSEDIHLNIDDIIQVYDTDNSGTLEDDELARFRRDLEMLQNRAFMNQHLDIQTGGPVTAASPLAARTQSCTTLNTLVRKLSATGGSSFLLPTGKTTPALPVVVSGTKHKASETPPQPQPVPPPRHESESTMPAANERKVQSASKLLVTTHELTVPLTVDEPESDHRDHVTPLITSSPMMAGPQMDPKWSESRSSSPIHGSSPRHHSHHQHHHRTQHSRSQTPSRHRASTVAMEEDPVLQRIAEMQRAMELRLQETEARLESKLLNLTKILLRVEHMMEIDD